MEYPTLRVEQSFMQKGISRIAGVDEAGRGALAGPVVAAAVMFPRRIPRALLGSVRDSKTLSERSRERLYGDIVAAADAWSAGIVSHSIIDARNILNATILAMQKAIAALLPAPDHVLIDGTIPRAHNKAFKVPYSTYVRGDGKIFSIAAASIIAKVTRDRLMRKLHRTYPAYGFARHKGYGTAAHYKALLRCGACAVHRKTFFLG